MGYLDNIPHAMRERKQWMLAGIDKRPMAVDYANESAYPGAKNNPTQRMDYAEARYWAETLGLYMGYIPLPDDPFTIIDLDWKDGKVYDVDSNELKLGLFHSACASTYVERSMSGQGAHIVIEGKLAHDFNVQTAGIECYGNKGFVVITGHMESASNAVSSQQSWLDFLIAKYPRAIEDALAATRLDSDLIHNAPPEELALDDALIASMSSWRNAANLERYFYGQDLRPDGGGGSEGDLALLQAFMSFTKSAKRDEAAMRMYLKTPRCKLRQPYKSATSNWNQYLSRTLNSARVMVARDEKKAKDYDFGEGSRRMLEQYQAQIAAAHQVSQPESAPPPLNMGGMAQRPPAPIASAEQPFTGFKWLTKNDLENLPRLEWAVKGLYPSAGLGAIYGESGSGKTFVAIDMMAAIAEGKKWFGLRTKQLPVSVFALEGEGGLKGRVKAWELVNGREYPHGVFFWDSARNGSFALRDADQRSDENRKRLIQLCADLKANGRAGGVVVIDTLNQASDGADENSSRDMGELLRAMKFIQRETGSLVLVVHHSTKSKENQSMRGHSSLYGAMDGIMEVIREVWTTPAEGSEEKPRLIEGRRGWVAKKVKDGRDGYTKLFDMKEVQVDFDEDGPVQSVAIKPVEEVLVDPETGEVQAIENTGSLKAPKPTSGNSSRGGGGSAGGGVRGRRPAAGDRQAPEVTRGHTWSASVRADQKQHRERSGNQQLILNAIAEDGAATRNIGTNGAPTGVAAAPSDEVIRRAVKAANRPDPAQHRRDLRKVIVAMREGGKLGGTLDDNGKEWIWGVLQES